MDKLKKMNYFNLSSVSKGLILLAVFLVPLIFYPSNIHFFANLKVGLFFATTLIVLILWSISRLKKDDFNFPVNLLSLSVLCILLVSLLSSIFSNNALISLFGVQLSTASFSGILILFVSALLIGSLFSGKRSSYIAIVVTYISLTITLLVNLLYIFVDVLPSFGFFVSNSVNTIGKWSDLGVISVLVILLSYLLIESKSGKSLIKKIAWVGLIISIISAIVVNEALVWVFLGLLSIFYLVYKIVVLRQNSEGSINKSLPYTTIVLILISFVMILGGNILSGLTDSLLNINYSEVRPGFSSTVEFTKNTLSEKPVLGVGTNRFDNAWQTYKPDAINQTNYWGTDFSFGFSYLTSLPAQVGILGLLAWLFFLVMLVWNAILLLFKKGSDEMSNKLNIISAFGILFFVMTLAVHVPSATVLILAFVFLGIFLGSLERNGLYKNVKISIDKKPKLGFLYIFSIIVLMILSIYLGYMSARQFGSTVLLERASYNLSTGNVAVAQRDLVNSINVYTTDLNLRALSEYNQIEINTLLSNSSLENQATIDAFRTLLTNSINAAAASISFDPDNYQNHLALAGIYEQLISLNVEGAYDQTINAYEAAKTVNPKNPGIILGMARAAFMAGENDVARDYISQSLEIKPSFADAAFLLSQIQVAEGNITEAIRSVEASINIQPNNSNLYFQLGLLRYNQEDYQGSVAAFERAVILNPIFANAKYFLGLSYYQVDRNEEAIGQFEDVNLLNPNNAEVETILSNLKAGISPFSGLTSDVPEDREELPLEEPVEEEE
jgi:tetratricopeptide (TPR) repeat protein